MGRRLCICLLVAHYPPNASGAERQAQAQARELARRGHEVHVLTSAVDGWPADADEQGVLVHRWARPTRWGPLFGLTFVAQLVRCLVRLRSLTHFEIIHTHQAMWEAVAAGVARSSIPRVPTLLQPASAGYYGEAEELARTRGFRLLQLLVLRNSHVAAISQEIESQWRHLGFSAERITRTRSGVDTSRFHPGASTLESNLPPRPRVVFTGRLHPQKNLDVLLNAWAAVCPTSPGSLLLAGDGPEQSTLRRLCEELAITDRVEFLGRLDDPAELLRASDLFVLPSVAEGMSNSLLEAMATGLAVAVSKIGGNTDLVTHNRNGVLIEPMDRHGWTTELRRLISDEQLRIQLGRSAHELILTEYALPLIVERNEQIYASLLRSVRTNA